MQSKFLTNKDVILSSAENKQNTENWTSTADSEYKYTFICPMKVYRDSLTCMIIPINIAV